MGGEESIQAEIKKPVSGKIPGWLAALSDEDIQFLKRFILCSGSLKELARGYSVSYPTIRSRLDRLIAKVRVAEAPVPADPFARTIQLLVADGRLSATLAKELISAHKKSIVRHDSQLEREREHE